MTSKAIPGILLAATILATAFVVEMVASGRGREGSLLVTRLIPVDSRELGHHMVEEVFRAELTHTGGPDSDDFAGVKAGITHPVIFSSPGLAWIVDGDLEFGTVRRGQSVESRDTFTIRRLKRSPLKLQHLRWAVRARADVVLSDVWSGTWRFTITSKDPDTGRVSAVDEITESLGAGEPVGLSRLPDFVRCERTSTDVHLEAECTARFRFPGCLANASARFIINRDAESIVGNGQWQINTTGDCGPGTGDGGEAIDIAATRISGDAEPEPFSPGVLTKIATTPAFSRFLSSASSDDDPDAPSAVIDCIHGRWRVLKKPMFPHLRACLAFVERGHGRQHDRR